MTKKIPSLKVPYYHHFKVFIFHSDLQVEQHCTIKKKKTKKNAFFLPIQPLATTFCFSFLLKLMLCGNC